MSQLTVRRFPSLNPLTLIESALAELDPSAEHPPALKIVPRSSWNAPPAYWQAMAQLESNPPNTDGLDAFWEATTSLPPIDHDSEAIELIECLLLGEGSLSESELASVLNCQTFNGKGVDQTWKAAALYSGQGTVAGVSRYTCNTGVQFFDATHTSTMPNLGHISFEQSGDSLTVIVDETGSASAYVHDLVLKYWSGEEFTFCRSEVAFAADPAVPNRYTATIPRGFAERIFLAVIPEYPEIED